MPMPSSRQVTIAGLAMSMSARLVAGRPQAAGGRSGGAWIRLGGATRRALAWIALRMGGASSGIEASGSVPPPAQWQTPMEPQSS